MFEGRGSAVKSLGEAASGRRRSWRRGAAVTRASPALHWQRRACRPCQVAPTLLMADSAKLSIEAIKPEKLRVGG